MKHASVRSEEQFTGARSPDAAQGFSWKVGHILTNSREATAQATASRTAHARAAGSFASVMSWVRMSTECCGIGLGAAAAGANGETLAGSLQNVAKKARRQTSPRNGPQSGARC